MNPFDFDSTMSKLPGRSQYLSMLDRFGPFEPQFQ